MVKRGVSAFRMPAKELLMRVSATQKRYAGKKLPKKPDNITNHSLFFGTANKALRANGIKTNPALIIRIEAT